MIQVPFSRPLTVLVLELLLFSSGLRAQDPGPGHHFRTFGWGVRVEDLHYFHEGADVPVKIYNGVRSPFLPFSPQTPLVLYRLSTDEEGNPVRTPLVQAKVEGKGEWPLLIIFPTGEAPGDGFRCVAISDDLESFHASEFRFINLTQAPIEIMVGENQGTVPPRGMHQVDPEVDSDGQRTETRFTTLSVRTQDGPVRVYSNNWAVRPTQRTLVLIHVQGEQLGVRRVLDDINQYQPIRTDEP